MWPIRLGEEEKDRRRKKEDINHGKNIMACPITFLGRP